MQQRTAHAELEAQKGQIREFTHTKKQLQKEVADLREQLEGVKSEASSECFILLSLNLNSRF